LDRDLIELTQRIMWKKLFVTHQFTVPQVLESGWLESVPHLKNHEGIVNLCIWSRVVNNFFLLWVVSRTVNQATKKQTHKYYCKWNQIIRRLFFVQHTRHILKLQNPSPVDYLRVRSWYQVQTGYLRVLSRYQIQIRILRTTTRIINTSTDHHSGGFSVCPSDTVKFTTAYI
jgi:hypothetical protein